MGDYGFTHEGRVYTPNGTTGIDPAENDARNAAIARAELEAWAAQPERFAGYVVERDPAEVAHPYKGILHTFGGKVLAFETFTGKHLGFVCYRSVYRGGFRDATGRPGRMEAIRVRGTNGATYYGRYGSDWSQLCRVRKVKG